MGRVSSFGCFEHGRVNPAAVVDIVKGWTSEETGKEELATDKQVGLKL